MRVTSIPAMPSSTIEAARRLNALIHKYPHWPTRRQVAADKPWHSNKRNDVLGQVEQRNDHWSNVDVAHRAAIVGQVRRIACFLEERHEEVDRLWKAADVTHIYLRHGLTHKLMDPASDIDLVLITARGNISYRETRFGKVTWPAPYNTHLWHIGYSNLFSILRGASQDELHLKIDMYRGICLFGEDLFLKDEQPPLLSWLALSDQILERAVQYLFNVRSFPGPSWAAKGMNYTLEVIHILKMLCPDLDTANFESIARLERNPTIGDFVAVQTSREDFLSRRLLEYNRESLRLLWECYHRLDSAFR